MASEFTDDEPKLTTKLRSEITEPEPAEFTPIRPAEPIVEQEEPIIASEDKEEKVEEPMESTDAAKVEERKPKPEKVRKSKVTTKAATKKEHEGKAISQLQSELRKHSDAKKKTDSAILDIRKELKDLLLIHHATIRDLQKQVSQMHRKIAKIDISKKSVTTTTGKKSTDKGKKIKKTTSKKKNRTNR